VELVKQTSLSKGSQKGRRVVEENGGREKGKMAVWARGKRVWEVEEAQTQKSGDCIPVIDA
jgi:hypothetical protein